MGYNIIVVDDDQDFLESIQRGLIVSGLKFKPLSRPLRGSGIY